MSVDPFPNELVEAAAKALRTSEIPITLSPTEGWVFDADESARAVLAAVLPLIEQRVKEAEPWVSLRKAEYGDEKEVLRQFRATGDADIEQRVIDKLAREAGENPYPEFHLPEHDGATGYADPCHAAWDEGAACGVAAERERWEEGREALTWIANADEDAINAAAEACENPGHVENHQDGPEWFCPDCGSGWWATDGTGPMCEINYVVAGVARRALAALAPERAGEQHDSSTPAQGPSGGAVSPGS